MNGAESLIATAVAANVEVCFANPGTTEMPLVAALDAVPGIRAILGLFEGVCTGAADGYARMTGKPALTLLHLGPGLANGLANLHNARRARSPIVNVIGEHATWHVASDPPLASDIVSLATPVSHWVRTVRAATDLAGDTAAAIAVASRPPGCVASLIVPADCQWGEVGNVSPPVCEAAAPSFDTDAIGKIARVLTEGSAAVLLLGGHALRERGLRAAARIAARTGCRLICESFPSRLERGAGLPVVERLPYFPEQVINALGSTVNTVLAGTAKPVAFFGYPGQPSHPVPKGCTIHSLADPTQDVVGALEALADEVGSSKQNEVAALAPPGRPSGALTTSSLGVAVAAIQPEGAIIMDESNTTGRGYLLNSTGCPPHTYLALTGGAIGMGLPCATGAAVACSDRPVIALQADGSGLYTLQALWTQARESLNVTTVICANRLYRILRVELSRAHIEQLGPQAAALTDLGRPAIDWVQVAGGLGVPAVSVETAEQLVRELERALAEPGPHLIEAVL